jgi:hypothetical protein
MKALAMKCNASQYEKIKPILLKNGFKEINITNFDVFPYLINNWGEDIKQLGNGWEGHLYGSRKVFQEWNEEIFLEYCGIKPEWKLPEKWCVKVTKENAVLLGEFYAKHTYEGYKHIIPRDEIGKYYTSHNKHSKSSIFSECPGSNFYLFQPNKEFPEISFEQFQTHVLKQNTNMQTLTLGQLKDLYNVSDCTKWQSKIGSYLGDNLLKKDDFKVEIKSEDIRLLLEEGNTTQKSAVEKLGIILSNPIEWDKIKTGSKVMLQKTGHHCCGAEKVDFDKPFDVVFFKSDFWINDDSKFSKVQGGAHSAYSTFHQDNKFILFSADRSTDYIVSVIEY